MNKDSILYWSHLKMYEGCPQRFLWTKGWDGIDLGNGDGRPKTKPDQQRSAHHAVMGVVIQYVIEKMYNDEMFREPQNLSKNLLKLVKPQLTYQLSERYVDFEEARMSFEDMLEVCEDGVVGYLQTMKKYRLLGPYSRAEVKLTGWINKWNPVGGFIDTIIRRDDTGITLLDGKNSKSKMAFTDPDQLLFYAMLFKLSYRKYPDRLAFVWYRFPFVEGGEEGVTWIKFEEEDIKAVAHRALEVKKKMHKKKFAASPSPKVCKFCEYQSGCAERQAQRKENAGKRKSSDIPEISNSDGFSDFSL